MVALVSCAVGLLGRPGRRLHRPRGALIFLGAGREQELRGSGRWEDSGGLHHGHAKPHCQYCHRDSLQEPIPLFSKVQDLHRDKSGND